MTAGHRYCILHDLDVGADAQPCGVAVERDGGVEVIAPAEKGIRAFHSEPMNRLDIQTLEQDQILPGHPEYFDEVLLHLHRTFALGAEHVYAPGGPELARA